MQTTLVPPALGKKSPANNGSKTKPKATPNGNIMAFFKKAEEQNNRIFLQERGSNSTIILDQDGEEDAGWSDEPTIGVIEADNVEQRYNENGGSVKKRKLSEELTASACTPPPPADTTDQSLRAPKKVGPFVDDSESEDEEEVPVQRRGTVISKPSTEGLSSSKTSEDVPPADCPELAINHVPPLPNSETTSQFGGDDFDDFEGLEDDDLLEGEEYDEQWWMQEQRRLEMEDAGFEGDPDDFNARSMFPEDTSDENAQNGEGPFCPICSTSLSGLSEQHVSIHVNACLDGNPLPVPGTKEPERESTPTSNNSHKKFKRPLRPARTGQQNPFQLGESAAPKSAFSRLMAGHAEDAAWATAATAEKAARGKPSFQRTCPFYKILPGFYICVDAFRYGAVKGQNAYFLSHFHSDHYVGLTKSWHHGPIYCSKVTANLVRQQLDVDANWVMPLEFEKKTEVPGTEGVHVTMIPANHCPGSSLFLFEKEVSKGKNPRSQRVLHCGDFRACQAHIEHPLLRPEVAGAVSGKSRQQKLDACYLDTTYLNPKYAFPPQHQVIQACAEICVSLNKPTVDRADGWEQMKKERAGEGMAKFVRNASDLKGGADGDKNFGTSKGLIDGSGKNRGRLLVVVGTYSIGKERICMGIAKALASKIYAPPNKQKICRALEDPELNALLTTNPREAQVHMTPLFEIRAQTLGEYLEDYRDSFSRVVGFRPSGWNYRPPNSRFTDSPSVQTVLHSQNWKSQFTMRDLTQQPGSTSRTSCYSVPYSEHSSFRELTMFCCALRIDKIIPTVNVGSAKSREKMKSWCEKWAQEKKKNGLFKLGENCSGW